MSYGYGDMFADDSDEGGSGPPPSSYRASGGGGGSVGAVQADSEVMEESISFAAESRRRPGRRHRVRRSPPPPPAPAPAALVADEAPAGAPPEPSPVQMEFESEPIAQNLRTEPASSEPASSTTEAQSQAAEGGEAGDGEPTEVDAQREQREAPLMIYEAGLTLAVNDVPGGVDAVAEFASETGGYVVRQDDNSIVIRVPAGDFREALEQLEALGDVIDRRISAQDVSETVRDLRIRLQNAEQMRERLMELLEETETVQESLVIERELERLNETIELIRGALNSLGERIAFSTITVNFQPVQTQQEVPNQLFRLPFNWLDELGLANLLRL